MFTYKLTSFIWRIHFAIRKMQWNYMRYRNRIDTFFRWEVDRRVLFLLGVYVGMQSVILLALVLG